ncbi:MAG: type I-C CRISPR-associated protein Cas8c/Csd1 [Chloroflexi bacterium]|nr:type I-C CRISPR-associated protein Cas8c/Csd1 [Chloroflexota bacterium]
MLPQLCDYARRLDLPPQLYGERPVRYIVELDATGRLLNPQPTDTADATDRGTRNGVRRLVPTVQRAVSIKPLLLADNAEYSFGLARDPAKQARVDRAHATYLDLIERCSDSTGDPAVQAIADFLNEDPREQLDLDEDFDRSACVTFRVDHDLPINAPAVQRFWAREHDPARAAGAVIGQCLVCGSRRPVLRRLQNKLKRVPGGQTSGTALISANARAFESYGLDASLIAPTCGECAELFTNGLNHLLASETQRTALGGAAFVYWTREDVEFNPLRMFTSPDPGQVRALLESVFTRRESAPFDDTSLYALSLSGSGGRAVVRDWIDTTVGDVRTSLAQWFQRQRIVGRNGESPAPVGLYALAAATVRDANSDLSPLTPRALLRAALVGTPLPPNLLSEAVRRNSAEHNVTRPRAALIRAVLRSQARIATEDSMIQLDEQNLEPAYRCGRLLAVLESAQHAALGITAVTDRFYGAASSAPASVFGRLLRGAQPHLTKLERERPGAYHALQQRLEDVLAGLNGFPKTLDMEAQGLFALGYYHQRAHDRAQVRARREGIDPKTGEVNAGEQEN